MKSNFMESYSAGTVKAMDFEEMIRVPRCEGLVEKHGEIIPGYENIWYEYLPESAKAKESFPLVVQVHGGACDGRRWVDFTVWHKVAEENGFMVIYPNAPDYETWKCGDRDIQYLYDLIEKICRDYPVDRTRIYMQGMSNGDMMTLAFTMEHPEVLAAAGYITGPSPEEMIGDERPTAPLPVIQMRGEQDVFFHLPDPLPDYIFEKRYSMNDLNRKLWQDVNEANSIPKMRIRGKNNFLYFKGEKAPVLLWEIKEMGHREPAEGAQVLWDSLYSFCRRVDGKIVCSVEFCEDEGDVVLCTGTRNFYKDGEIRPYAAVKDGVPRIFEPTPRVSFFPVKLDEMFNTRALYAPAEFFREAFGAKLEVFEAGDRIVLTFPCGDVIELYSKAVLVKKNGKYTSLKKPCALLCGQFWIPVAEFCRELQGKCVSEQEGVMLITDHYSELSRYTARMLRQQLGGILTV